MRILKIVLIAIAILIGLYLLISLFLPSNYNVSRTININSSRRAVFNQVNEFRNWEAWSPWMAKDSTLALRYSDNSEGKGANLSWTSELTNNGSQQIIAVFEMDTIRTALNFEGGDPANEYWYFNAAGDNRTELTWGRTGELSFFNRFSGLFIDGNIGGDFETGLSNLKYLVESQKGEFVERPVNTVSKDSIIYLSVTETVNMASLADEGSALYARNYGKILLQLGKKADSIINGAPFAIYHEWNEETRQATIEFCIPVDTTSIEVEDEVKRRILSQSQGLEVDFYGPYALVGQAHLIIEEYAANNNVQLAPFGIEFYVSDPAEEPDTSKWLTKVYYPKL